MNDNIAQFDLSHSSVRPTQAGAPILCTAPLNLSGTRCLCLPFRLSMQIFFWRIMISLERTKYKE
jgi:hypothetical protein